MAIFDDLQVYADVGGWAQKSQKHADVVLEWVLMQYDKITRFIQPMKKW